MTYLEKLAQLLCAAGWRNVSTGRPSPPDTINGWWEELISRHEITPEENEVLDFIVFLRTAGIDMDTVVR